MIFNHHIFAGCRFEKVFHKLFLHFEGVLLAVRGCTCVLRGCSRTLKIPHSPPLPVLYLCSVQCRDAVSRCAVRSQLVAKSVITR